MKKQFTIISVLIIFILNAPYIFSQGSISGKVSDSLTTETLIGANISIEGTCGSSFIIMPLAKIDLML